MKYEQLYRLTLENGGATVRVKDYPEKIVSPTKGFAVGNNSEALVLHNARGPQAPKIFDNFIDRQLIWASGSGEFEYLGTWLDGDELYVEPVDVFADKSFALGVAWARGEKAAFDLENKKEIRIKHGK
jgi:hypothetical protein